VADPSPDMNAHQMRQMCAFNMTWGALLPRRIGQLRHRLLGPGVAPPEISKQGRLTEIERVVAIRSQSCQVTERLLDTRLDPFAHWESWKWPAGVSSNTS